MKINKRSLMEGLAYALDVAEKSYFSHSKHVAYTAVSLARELELPPQVRQNVYYAALLHDIGASNTYLISEHCIIGRDILMKLPVDECLAEYVYYHHEYEDGSGAFGVRGEAIPVPSQIICLSDLFDKRFCNAQKQDYAFMNEVEGWCRMHAELFNPAVLEAFLRLIRKEYFFLDYYNQDFRGTLKKRVRFMDDWMGYDGVRAFADAFAKIIDNRSPFTHRHSMGIAQLVNRVSEGIGYEADIRQKMEIAALLHDVGKLVVPNEIIDKEGRLEPAERFEINKHTYYTRWILEQIEGFEEIADYAANHHEKLNGTGYPLHLSGDQIGEPDRIMAICDIYQALTEERPYRKEMPMEKVWSIMDQMAEKEELDKRLVEMIKHIL